MVQNLNGWGLNRTTMGHPNSDRVRYSSPHCMANVCCLSLDFYHSITGHYGPDLKLCLKNRPKNAQISHKLDPGSGI